MTVNGAPQRRQVSEQGFSSVVAASLSVFGVIGSALGSALARLGLSRRVALAKSP